MQSIVRSQTRFACIPHSTSGLLCSASVEWACQLHEDHIAQVICELHICYSKEHSGVSL